MIPVLVLFALLSGCALVDRAADLTGRAFTGGRETTPVGDPLSLHLQLALLSDRVVTRIVQDTETPLDAIDDPNRRAALLRLRLHYASAMWNAASGPNPYANAINMLLTLTVGRRRLERSSLADALGGSLRPTLAILRSAESDVERLVRRFLTPAELSALDQVIRETPASQVEGPWLGIGDLPELLSSSRGARSGGGRGSTNLFSILGLDPFAGLDPATREIAESRQFGERLLFNVQRMPVLLRLNAELLATQVAADLGLGRAQASLDRATTAMEQVAETAAGLPERLSAERAQIVSDVRAEADRLGALARDYRGLFDAATTTAGTADQALQTFAGVMQRFEPENGQPSAPSRPFAITEYAETANRIGEAAVNLSGLMSRVQETLDSPSATRLTPEVEALVAGAEERARRWLYGVRTCVRPHRLCRPRRDRHRVGVAVAAGTARPEDSRRIAGFECVKGRLGMRHFVVRQFAALIGFKKHAAEGIRRGKHGGSSSFRSKWRGCPGPGATSDGVGVKA